MRITDLGQAVPDEVPLCVSIQTCGKSACKGMSSRGSTETDEPQYTDQDLAIQAKYLNEPDQVVEEGMETDSIGGLGQLPRLPQPIAPLVGLGISAALFFATTQNVYKYVAVGGAIVSVYALVSSLLGRERPKGVRPSGTTPTGTAPAGAAAP